VLPRTRLGSIFCVLFLETWSRTDDLAKPDVRLDPGNVLRARMMEYKMHCNAPPP
jgi:hypothetical protein